MTPVELDTTQLLAIAAALGWASGLRLYLVVFLTGLAGHLGWVELPQGDASHRLAVPLRQQQTAGRRRILSRKVTEFVAEILKIQINTQRGGVFLKQGPRFVEQSTGLGGNNLEHGWPHTLDDQE